MISTLRDIKLYELGIGDRPSSLKLLDKVLFDDIKIEEDLIIFPKILIRFNKDDKTIMYNESYLPEDPNFDNVLRIETGILLQLTKLIPDIFSDNMLSDIEKLVIYHLIKHRGEYNYIWDNIRGIKGFQDNSY